MRARRRVLPDMASAIGTGDKKSVNVELNIIPFIDLMSCLTAFLLVTAVWVNIARLEVRPSGRATQGQPCLDDDDCNQPKLSVLINADEIWVGVSRVNDFQRIPNVNGQYDWTKLEATLKDQKASAYFQAETRIEIAAGSTRDRPVAYQQLIATMDVAVKTGFVDVGLTDPDGLSARPTL
jgi:biopolymer transport protein ExbD